MASSEAPTLPAAEIDCHALLTPEAVRSRCAIVFGAVERDGSPWFRLRLDRLPAAVRLVERVTREAYPRGPVPFHSRWRHFETAAGDLWQPLAERLVEPRERLRAAVDLAVVSVLLDAGAGADWRYADTATGTVYRRSEGLAVASLRAFEAGLFSTEPGAAPWRVDAAALVGLDDARLAAAMQAGPGNPLVGLDARAALLRNLGHRLLAIQGEGGRPGLLAERLLDGADDGRLPARAILVALLEALNPIWPDGTVVDGVALGDVGRHPAAGLVPFHKLSQWLAYSLIEPLRDAGLAIVDVDGLTGLPEYRNGGLFLDTGVIEPVDPDLPARALRDDDEAVVEWRALTVILLDRVAVALRAALGETEETLPLAAVLQGGTWAAGRRIAAERRAGGAPPLRLVTTGTRF